MKGLGILILVVLFFWLAWPMISRWLKRKAMERAEDYMRASMGMPPRDKKKNKTGTQKDRSTGDAFYGHRTRRNPFGPDRFTDEPIIPKEYAEDVEFTETIDYSTTDSRKVEGNKVETYHESQISDAEFIEIKKSRTK